MTDDEKRADLIRAAEAYYLVARDLEANAAWCKEAAERMFKAGDALSEKAAAIRARGTTG